MRDFSSKSVLVIDHGLFFSWAQKLAPAFGECSYYVSPADDLFPTARKALIGDGFKGIKRVQNLYDAVRRADLIVCPDVFLGDLAEHLRTDMGKRVWGAFKAEELELDRWRAKQVMERAGLPSNPTVKLIGLQALRDHLRTATDKFVKVSRYRGISETFHHIDYRLSESKLDEMEHQLGMQKYLMPFLVEDAIDSVSEPGWDGYTIDGQYPPLCITGFEVKDRSYIGAVHATHQTYAGLAAINAGLASEFKRLRYRGFFSTEARVTKQGVCYPIDLTCRAASPAGETYQELFSNWPEIIWHGASGELVEPVVAAKFGAQLIITSGWAERDWQALYFPPAISQWIKLYNPCRIRSQTCIVPQETAHLKEIGSVVGIGNTLEQAVQRCKDYAAQIEGYMVDCNASALDDAEKVVAEASKAGIKFPASKRAAA